MFFWSNWVTEEVKHKRWGPRGAKPRPPEADPKEGRVLNQVTLEAPIRPSNWLLCSDRKLIYRFLSDVSIFNCQLVPAIIGRIEILGEVRDSQRFSWCCNVSRDDVGAGPGAGRSWTTPAGGLKSGEEAERVVNKQQLWEKGNKSTD